MASSPGEVEALESLFAEKQRQSAASKHPNDDALRTRIGVLVGRRPQVVAVIEVRRGSERETTRVVSPPGSRARSPLPEVCVIRSTRRGRRHRRRRLSRRARAGGTCARCQAKRAQNVTIALATFEKGFAKVRFGMTVHEGSRLLSTTSNWQVDQGRLRRALRERHRDERERGRTSRAVHRPREDRGARRDPPDRGRARRVRQRAARRRGARRVRALLPRVRTCAAAHGGACARILRARAHVGAERDCARAHARMHARSRADGARAHAPMSRARSFRSSPPRARAGTQAKLDARLLALRFDDRLAEVNAGMRALILGF